MVITRSRSGRDEIVTVTGHTAWFGKTHHTRFRTVRESRQAHDGEGAQKVSFTKMTLTFSQPPNNVRVPSGPPRSLIPGWFWKALGYANAVF